MRVWKPRERMLAGAVLTALAAGVLFETVFDPLWTRYARVRAEVAGLEAALTRMRANMQVKDQIETRYEQLKGLIHESGSASQEMSRFARLLTDLCGPLGVQMRSVRPLPDQDEGFYRKFALSLEMEGPVTELAGFLAAVARAKDSIRIEHLELTCRDRPDVVTASIIVAKVATASGPARESAPPRAARIASGRSGRGGRP